jgi:hypothetical protein
VRVLAHLDRRQPDRDGNRAGPGAGALAPLSIPLYGRAVLHRGSEMGLKGRWLSMALLAVAVVALAGCAGAALSEPCGGFYMCMSWH